MSTVTTPSTQTITDALNAALQTSIDATTQAITTEVNVSNLKNTENSLSRSASTATQPVQ